MRRRRALAAAVGLILGLGVDDLSARPPTGCQIAMVEPLTFGAYDPHAREPLDTRGTVSIRCEGVSYMTLDVERSGPPGAGLALRNGRYELRYEVYLDPARTLVWGDGTRGTGRYGPAAPKGEVIVPVYARMPAGQRVMSGAYADAIVFVIGY